MPSVLLQNLESMNVRYYLQSLVKGFLVDNSQSSALNCDIGLSTELCLSPVFFSFTLNLLNLHQIERRFYSTHPDDIVGFLNFKAPSTSYPYFKSIQNFVEQCASVNLFINSTKNMEMVVSFGRTYGIYDYLFINGSRICLICLFV